MPGLITPIHYPREYVSAPTKDDIVRTFKKWTTIRWMYCHKHGVRSGLILSDSGQLYMCNVWVYFGGVA